MSDRPLFIGVLIGLIVILIIGTISLLTKTNSFSNLYRQEVSRNIATQKSLETIRDEGRVLKEENIALQGEIQKLNGDIVNLKTEIVKLEKLKNKLEENLKDELIKTGPEVK